MHGDCRLRYPLKLVGGQWQRLPWEQAIDEIATKMLSVRKDAGADGLHDRFREDAERGGLLFRKFGAHGDQLDRSPSAHLPFNHCGWRRNTWGYGAQTNSYNDLCNSKTMIIMGGIRPKRIRSRSSTSSRARRSTAQT